MRPSARERRTIVIAAWVSVAALALAYLAIPFGQRTSSRNTETVLKREQVGRLRGYVARRVEIDSLVAARENALAQSPTRVLRGRSTALVAADLQRRLQEYARLSRVSVSRLDVAGVPDSAGDRVPSMSATISAAGDIYGLAQLLTTFERGPELVEVSELSIVSTSGLRGDLLQLSLRVRAPYVLEAPR